MLERVWEKREPSYTIGGHVNGCSHSGEQYGGFSKKLKTELAYDQVLGIHHKS